MSECCFQMFLEIFKQRNFCQISWPFFVFKCFQQFVKKFCAEEKVGCKLELSAGLRMDKVDLCFPLFVSFHRQNSSSSSFVCFQRQAKLVIITTILSGVEITCKTEFVFVCLFVCVDWRVLVLPLAMSFQTI